MDIKTSSVNNASEQIYINSLLDERPTYNFILIISMGLIITVLFQ